MDNFVGPPRLEITQAVEREILRRTHGRVRSIQVELEGERIVVRGWATTNHVKQLVLYAIDETLGDGPFNREIRVEVASIPARPNAEGRADH